MKTKALISFAVTAKLICVFVFAYADCWFYHEAAQLFPSRPFSKCSPCEMTRIMADMFKSGGSNSDVQILFEGCRLGLQYGMVGLWFLFVRRGWWLSGRVMYQTLEQVVNSAMPISNMQCTGAGHFKISFRTG